MLRDRFPWMVHIHRRFYRWRFANLCLEQRFNLIYDWRWWGNTETVSGVGSRLDANISLVESLPSLFSRLGVSTVLDAPCGDFNWMRNVDLSGIEYLGVDIVDRLVLENSQKYGNAHTSFEHLDVVTDTLPFADLIICKDLMIHLSNKSIFKLMHNLASSRSQYVLLTTSLDLSVANEDIYDGYYRRINLTRPPFNLPKPIEFLASSSENLSDGIGLWRICQLRNYIDERL